MTRARSAQSCALPAGHLRTCQLVRGIDHDPGPALDPDRAAEPDPGPAFDAGDVRAAVEQRGQVPGGVADLAGQHRVPLHRPDLDHADPALDGDLARLVARADRGDIRAREWEV